jgi:hypothetical protein
LLLPLEVPLPLEHRSPEFILHTVALKLAVPLQILLQSKALLLQSDIVPERWERPGWRRCRAARLGWRLKRHAEKAFDQAWRNPPLGRQPVIFFKFTKLLKLTGLEKPSGDVSRTSAKFVLVSMNPACVGIGIALGCTCHAGVRSKLVDEVEAHASINASSLHAIETDLTGRDNDDTLRTSNISAVLVRD